MKDIKITIITVCKNADRVLESTIKSVVSQTYRNIQYIIIDGASTDGTLEIVHKYQMNYPIICMSEPDRGIYDAMNKGIMMSSGDYIEFLNAGDKLYEATTVENIVDIMSEHKADIYYGNIIYLYSDNHTEIRKYGKWCSKRIYDYTGDCINHQAIFASTDLLKETPFDVHYKICADREWIMRARKMGASFKPLSIQVCYYSLDETSVSISQKALYSKEANECVRKHYRFGYFVFAFFDFCRNNKILGQWLHRVYNIIYIRK